MKIAIVGQQDFGKAVLEAFLARGDTVAGVFVAPEKEGAKPDPMKVAAQEKGLKVFQFASLKSPEATQAMKDLGADIGIMAFVLQFAPQEFVTIPKHGTIQYHPSLLPKYRGLHTHRRALEACDDVHGVTVHFVTEELDGGPLIIQSCIDVRPDDTETALSARVQRQEHTLYPQVIEWFATGRLALDGDAVTLDGNKLPTPIVIDARGS